MIMLQNRFFTVSQAAAYIGCTESYIRQLLRAQIIAGEKIGQRAWIIPISEAEHLKKSTPTGKPGRPRAKKSVKGS
jgi:excisionase family DNA binding protein